MDLLYLVGNSDMICLKYEVFKSQNIYAMNQLCFIIMTRMTNDFER